MPPDEVTRAYLNQRLPSSDQGRFIQSDQGAGYAETKEYCVSDLEPQVAFPHSPENVHAISRIGRIAINQAVIGSCTNGRLEDLEVAARVLNGRRADPSVRLIIIPATPWIYEQALRRGYLETFIKAHAIISPPTCGPCLGGHMGILAKGERAIATTNRNFVGRMGHPESEVYLASPAIAAASAVAGYICGPEEIEVKDKP
jgi:3-isopropylmalate/(R)-2-methylmalate dehydratase large subunit